MTRHGKVARLGHALREELNGRLREGVSARELVEWINGLPEAQAIFERKFGGRPLNEQNLSQWKNGGYREWLVRQEMMSQAAEIEPMAAGYNEVTDGKLTESLSTVVATRYVVAMMQWKGKTTDEFRRRMRELRGMCRDVAGMRREDYHQGWLKLERERLEWQQTKMIQERQGIRSNQLGSDQK